MDNVYTFPVSEEQRDAREKETISAAKISKYWFGIVPNILGKVLDEIAHSSYRIPPGQSEPVINDEIFKHEFLITVCVLNQIANSVVENYLEPSEQELLTRVLRAFDEKMHAALHCNNDAKRLRHLENVERALRGERYKNEPVSFSLPVAELVNRLNDIERLLPTLYDLIGVILTALRSDKLFRD